MEQVVRPKDKQETLDNKVEAHKTVPLGRVSSGVDNKGTRRK